jgi:hypothetical protein
LLVPQRLDLAAMKLHHFVTANSCAGKLVYRMLFTDGEEREVPLPQPSLFSIHRRPWSRSKEELEEQLGLLGFHVQHGDVDRRKRRRRPITLPCTTPGRPRAHIRTKVLLRHILETSLHGRAGTDLHLGQKPKLRGGTPTIHSSIYNILSILCISMFRFLFFVVLVLISTFQNTKRPKIFPLFLFVCLFSFLALVCFTSYF